MRCFEKVSNCDNQQIIVLDLAGHEHIKDGYVFTLGPGMSLPSIQNALFLGLHQSLAGLA